MQTGARAQRRQLRHGRKQSVAPLWRRWQLQPAATARPPAASLPRESHQPLATTLHPTEGLAIAHAAAELQQESRRLHLQQRLQLQATVERQGSRGLQLLLLLRQVQASRGLATRDCSQPQREQQLMHAGRLLRLPATAQQAS